MAGRGSRGVSTTLMLVAVVAVAGFLVWLHWRSRAAPESVEPVTQQEQVEADRISADELLADLEAAIGSPGLLDSVPVNQRLGQAAFAVQLNGDRYPVLMTTELLQRQTQVYGGDLVSVRGQIYPLNDSIRNAWVDQGLVEEQNRADLPGTPSFLLADSVGIH